MAELFGANIASTQPGIGAGEAQIFDTSNLERRYDKQIADEKKRQDLQDKEIADQLSKINPDGIRAADEKDFQKLYNNTYGAFRKLQLAKASKDRNAIIKAQTELDQAKANTLGFIAGSKNENKSNALVAADILHDKKAYTKDAGSHWKKVMDTPMSDPTYKTLADPSLIGRQPAKVDLNDIFVKAAKESVATSDPKVIREGGAKFDTKSKILHYPTLASRIKLEYTRDPDIQDRIDEVYDPAHFDPQTKAQLEKEVGRPLNTSYELAGADAYVTNKKFLNTSDRKQITEKTPRAGATTISFAMPNDGSGEGARQIFTATPYLNKSNQTFVKKGAATTEGSFQFPTMKLSVSSSPDLKDASSGQTVTKTGAYDTYGSEINVLPVYKKGTKNSTGKDVSGLVVPDDEKDNAVQNGQASYKLMFHAQHGQVVGMSKDAQGNDTYILSKDATPVYLPASSSVISVLQQKTTKANQPMVAAKLSQLYAKAQELNHKYSQPQQNKENKTVNSPKLKVDPKKRLY